MKVNRRMAGQTGKGRTPMLTAENTLVSGRITKRMDRERILPLTITDMWVSLKMVRLADRGR